MTMSNGSSYMDFANLSMIQLVSFFLKKKKLTVEWYIHKCKIQQQHYYLVITFY